MSKTLDDIASKLPQVEFKTRKKANKYYNQPMQSKRGGRQFILRTSPDIADDNVVKITLIEYGKNLGEEFIIGNRYALFNDGDTLHKALKSLERKAKCKLYYVLLISTDGEYL